MDMFFPTTLCGVLVFVSVSHASSSAASRSAASNHLSHTTLSHIIFHTQLCHTLSFTHATLSHTFVLRGRRGTWQHRPSFCVASMALMALRWVWWRGGPLVARDVAALCVAGVALGDIRCLFAWQVWCLVTSTFSSRGRRGAYGTGLGLVARLGAAGRR